MSFSSACFALYYGRRMEVAALQELSVRLQRDIPGVSCPLLDVRAMSCC